jgi:hypothetical protein|nr:MAG TPA: hypothetical protein [Caudoviricetes sp.]
MNLDEAIARTKEASESQRLGELGRETALQLAAWLEELKQYKEQYKEQNQETNLDHFQQEVLEKGLWNLAVAKGRPERCDHTKCIDCELSKDRSRGCHEKVMNWLKQPRKAPAIKLTKFEIDLLQSCSQVYSPEYQFKSIAFLTEMREKGYFKGVNRDATIEDILANSEITEED